MADPRFYRFAGPYRLDTLAKEVGAKLADAGVGDRQVRTVAPLEDAAGEALTFLENSLYTQAFRETGAAACLVREAYVDQAPAGLACLVTDEPYRAYAQAVALLHPIAPPPAGIADGAHVAAAARLAPSVAVEAGAVIHAGAELGERAWIESGAVIGPGVRLGSDTRIGAGANVFYAYIGNRCHIYSGAQIGQDGFGFAPSATGHEKIPQVGRVIIEDDVWVGANSGVDRGANRDTILRAGVRLDNLVQVGHNCVIGKLAILCGQVGLSGSVTVGDGAVLGGQAGVANHVTIGEGSQVAAQAGVTKDVPAGDVVYGFPATSRHMFWRQMAALRKLAKGSGGR